MNFSQWSKSLFAFFCLFFLICIFLHFFLVLFLAVSITDKASVIFGGTDAPAALGNMYSIGAIAIESNGKITASVTDLLEPFGVEEDRIYINFFDMERSNVGWSRRTFAG